MKGLSQQEYNDLIPQGTILLGYRGSIAHGTYLPSDDPNSIDDKDVMGVCIPTIDHFLGLKQFEQRERMIREWDSVVYEIRKFVRLLMNSNPNVLSLLWLREQDHIKITPEGQMLIDARKLFVTKKIYYAFTGYAYGQRKRMTHFEKRGYMGEKRKALVAKYGYDIKNASHLIRLLHMGIEFLKEGELHVYRHDAPMLIQIKTGQWTLDQVKAEADNLFKRAEAAYDECKFPVAPSPEAANNLVLNIVKAYFANNNKEAW